MALKPLNFEYEGPIIPIPGVPKEKRHMTLLNGFRGHYRKDQMFEVRIEWVGELRFLHFERAYIDATDFESMMCCRCDTNDGIRTYYVSYVNQDDRLMTTTVYGWESMKELVLELCESECAVLDIQQEV